jgi:Ser/Thr protein kinase RdoA (MazF antagonist)
LANHRAFARTAAVRVAPIIGQSARRGALLLEWLPGEPLDTLLAQPGELLGAAIYGAGQALAALHRPRPSLPVHYTPTAEAEALAAAVGAIGEIVPAYAARAQVLDERLRPQLAERTTPCCVIHGDFSADQVLWQGTPAAQHRAVQPPVAILDLDRAGYGAPAADLGSFLAHLHQLELRQQLDAGQRQIIGDQLLAAYQHHTAAMPTAAEIRVQTAVRLLRLAPDAFRQRWCADWPVYTEAVLARVETILNKQGDELC